MVINPLPLDSWESPARRSTTDSRGKENNFKITNYKQGPGIPGLSPFPGTPMRNHLIKHVFCYLVPDRKALKIFIHVVFGHILSGEKSVKRILS
jgi:hypothetical protein